jgi:formylglycine-generating enzyme required for sulfatase activity/serine/threonine protein kinase
MSDSHEPPITCLAPELAQLALLFPGYVLELMIATGGMGAVYRAVQKSLDRTVAIKILPREFSKNAAFCAGFEAEAKAMAHLNHPNLIGVYDFGEVDGMLFIIMEYVPGKSLFHSAHGIAIDPGEVIRLVTGICNGLAHAHKNGIIHRDIKPSNILLDLNAQPKIGDFGLAHPIEGEISRGGEVFGTPHYTAPEVVHAPQSVDHRADIFSVGVILHELLTGRLPGDDPQPASGIVPCDPRFDSIIRRATDPRPKYRFTNVHEITKDLHAIASSAGPRELVRPSRVVPPQPAPGRTQASPPQQKASNHKGIIMGVLAIVLGIVTYSLYSNQQKARQIVHTPPPPVAPIPVAVPKLPPAAPIPAVVAKPKPEPPREPLPKPEPKPEPPPVQNPVPPPGTALASQPKIDVSAAITQPREITQDKPEPAPVPELETLQKEYASRIKAADAPYRAVVAELDKKYIARLELEREAAQQAGKLDEALAIDEEKKAISSGNGVPDWDDDKTPGVLRKMRATYRAEIVKLEPTRENYLKPLRVDHARQLDALVLRLTQGGKLKEAMIVRQIRKDLPTVSTAASLSSSAGKVMSAKLPGGVGMKFCYCPPGGFMMGSPPDERGSGSHEDQVNVKLSKGFWMAQTECTQAQWVAVMGGNPSGFIGDNLPVEKVSWNDVRKFITKLNDAKTLPAGWKSALPSEAQWEYACRAGTKTAFSFGDTLDAKQANIGNALGKTGAVASYPANAWGLYDMHGNVWEWCEDWHDRYPSGARTDPIGPDNGSHRVNRGGAWDDGGTTCRSDMRDRGAPDARHSSMGFRLVLTALPEASTKSDRRPGR